MSNLKSFLNRQASQRLRQAGYSNRMIDEAKRQAWWWLDARGQALARRRPLLAGCGVVWSRLGYAELLPIEVPLAGPGEVTLEVLSSAVSPGTERAGFTRLPNTAARGIFRPGYSAAGTVLSVGAGVTGIGEGDLVAARDVKHASVATSPAGNVYRVPEGVSAAEASLVKLGVIACQSVRLAQVEPGEHVAVLGAGLIGVLAQRAASAAGADARTMVARSRRKEAWAIAGGVQSFLTTPDDHDDIAALSASVVIEATGDPNAVVLAVSAAADGGRVILLGSPRGTTSELPVDEIRRKRLTLIGAHVETLSQEERHVGGDPWRREADAFLAAVASGHLAVHDLLPRVVDAREAGTFYRELVDDPDLFGARFDWGALPRNERVRRARVLRLPDISGRGTDSEHKPLAAPRRRTGGGVLDLPDPFSGASGHLRVGLLGCGDIAVHNAAAVATAPNASLSACFDPVPGLADEIAQGHGAAVVESAEALVARDDVDAVFIAVPHHLHLPLASLAAAAGKHLMVEKPPANDLAAAAELVNAAERSGVHLSFCFPQRYDADAAVARRLIEAGAIGELEGAVVRVLQERSPAYRVGGFSGRSISDWRTNPDKAGGGVLIMNLCHHVELVTHLTGLEVDRISAFTDATQLSQVESSVSIAATFSNGAVGTFFGSVEARGSFSPEVRLFGREGHVVVQPEPKVITDHHIPGLHASRWQDFGHPVPRDMRAVYVSRFATAVHTGERPDISSREGLATQAFMEAAYASAASGSSVSPRELVEARVR